MGGASDENLVVLLQVCGGEAMKCSQKAAIRNARIVHRHRTIQKVRHMAIQNAHTKAHVTLAKTCTR